MSLFRDRGNATGVFLLIWNVFDRLPDLLVWIPQVQANVAEGDITLSQVIDDLL